MQTPVHSSPEEAFVVDCARSRSLPPRDLNWPRVREIAAEHRVTPLLSGFPQPEQNTRNQVRWSLLLSAELIRLLDILEKNGIGAIPFKGPVLAQTLYGDPALRESCDIDLLVRVEDIRRVPSVLAAEGYTTDLPSDQRARDAYVRTRYELHFTSPMHGVPIEIHQSFVAPSYCLDLNYDAIWERARPTQFFGREVLTLAPSDLLLMLCIHGAKHEWKELIHIADIARLFAGEQLFLPDAAGFGAERIVRIGLLLASQVLDAPIPADVLRSCERDRAAVDLANEARRRLFDDRTCDSPLRSHRWFLRSRERLRDRLKMCASLVCSPTEKDYSVFAFPDFLSPLYFPLHALRMVRKYTLAALRSAPNELS